MAHRTIAKISHTYTGRVVTGAFLKQHVSELAGAATRADVKARESDDEEGRRLLIVSLTIALQLVGLEAG